MRGDGAGFAQHLSAFYVVAFGATQQDADVVSGLPLVEQFAEHFYAGDGAFLGVADADNGDFVADFDDATLNTTGDDGATPGDGEDVFDGHEEGAVNGALGLRDVAVEGGYEFVDGGHADVGGVAFKCLEGGAYDDGGVVARKFVAGEQVADFHFDQLEQFGVVYHVGFVEEDDDVGHAYLTGEQDVFAGLGHRAVSRAHDQDGAVHLRRTGDHVFDVVGMAGAVYMGVVAVFGFVFDVRGGNGDPTGAFFRGVVNLVVGTGFATKFFGLYHGQRGGQGCFPMVYVTNGSHVDVRLLTLKFFLGHGF